MDLLLEFVLLGDEGICTIRTCQAVYIDTSTRHMRVAFGTYQCNLA